MWTPAEEGCKNSRPMKMEDIMDELELPIITWAVVNKCLTNRKPTIPVPEKLVNEGPAPSHKPGIRIRPNSSAPKNVTLLSRLEDYNNTKGLKP